MTLEPETRSHDQPDLQAGEPSPEHSRPRNRRWGMWALFALLAGFYIYANRPVPAAFAWEHDYEAGRRKAAEQGLPVLLEFQAPGCGACAWMDREVFSRPEVARALEGWVPIRVDGNQNPRLMVKYGAEAYPTFRMLSPDGQVLGGFVGAVPAEDFIRALERSHPGDARQAGESL